MYPRRCLLGCPNDCRVHWDSDSGAPYPILVVLPGPMVAWDPTFPPVTQQIEVKVVRVHCGPASPYPLRWRHNV